MHSWSFCILYVVTVLNLGATKSIGALKKIVFEFPTNHDQRREKLCFGNRKCHLTPKKRDKIIASKSQENVQCEADEPTLKVVGVPSQSLYGCNVFFFFLSATHNSQSQIKVNIFTTNFDLYPKPKWHYFLPSIYFKNFICFLYMQTHSIYEFTAKRQ